MSEIEKAIEANATEKVEDNKSDIDAQELDEVDKNGDSKVVEETVSEDETEEDKKNRACRQIEFYFSDSNLPYDRFMWTLHTTNAEHWVPIKTVSSFKRMREFQSLGKEWILDALKASKEVELDEKEENIRRITEVKEPKGQFERSIYAKGFGKEEPGLQQKLEKYFNTFGRFNAVRMRRNNDTKEFKGSVFVEFSDLSSAERFLNSDPKPSWEGEELLIMSKDAYCEMKIKEKGLKGKSAQYRKSCEGGNGLRRGFNAFRLGDKDKKGKDSKDKSSEKPVVYLDFMGKKLLVKDEENGRVDEAEVPYVKNTALRVTGLDGDLTFDDIKGPLKDKFEHPPFIKFDRGASFGLVGFSRALSDEDLAFIKEKVTKVSGKEVSWVPAEEEEEKAFLIERAQNAARRVMMIASRNSAKAGSGKGRGGKNNFRSGGRDNKKPATKDINKSSKPSNGTTTDPAAGEKRKRAVEPDGGPDVGIRGATIPTVASSKKAKTEES